ncbi:MAG: FlgD immunoglobulin-like domain containing protein, partial [Acidobacteriota bacterium]
GDPTLDCEADGDGGGEGGRGGVPDVGGQVAALEIVWLDLDRGGFTSVGWSESVFGGCDGLTAGPGDGATLKVAERPVPNLGALQWPPGDEALFVTSGDFWSQDAWVAFLGEGDPTLDCEADGDGGVIPGCLEDDDNRWLRFLEAFPNRRLDRVTPSGRLMLFLSDRDADDPASACGGFGTTDAFLMRSLMNLTADLRIRRSVDPTNVLLDGTAADVNFASYQLEYSSADGPEDWRAIAPPSGRQVFDGLFQTWVPPGPGAWLVRLTVTDMAGNTRRAVRRVATAGFPKLTDVYLEPELFSPNFDGLLDTTAVHYRALEPVNVDVTVEDGDGTLVALLEQAAPTPGDYRIVWDGRGLDGRVVDDGVYVVRLDGHEMQVEVDTTPVAVGIVYEEP